MKDYKNRIGEKIINNQGYVLIIIDYIDSRNVLVEFQDEHKYRRNVRYSEFKNKGVQNPYHKTNLGIGYLGGLYEPNKETSKISYKTWARMMTRCYSESSTKLYKDCYVCDEWHNYSNFKKWFDKNYYNVYVKRMDLDKDILVKGNKLYSPNTCIFVPHDINILFRDVATNHIKFNEKCKYRPFTVYYMDNNSKRVVKCFEFEEDAVKHSISARKEKILFLLDKYSIEMPKMVKESILNII